MAERAPQAGTLAAGRTRLPPGKHGLSRDFVAENQRQRLLNGVVDAVAEHGYEATTIARISAAAKISRRTFYEHFEGKRECFLAAYEMIERHLLDEMLGAPGAGEEWPERAPARLAALLEVLSRDAAVSRCFLVAPLAAGGEVAARYREAMQLVGEALRPEPAPADLDLEARDQALVGGLATLIVRRLRAGEAERLPELLPDLTELTLSPYMSREEAKRIAASTPLPEP
ncbi:MAG: TetR/AcrR family transcriptional regulator [Thermoleophilaceae bacterium]